MKKIQPYQLFITFSTGILLSYIYIKVVVSKNISLTVNLLESITNGTAPQPYNHRVLIPYLNELIINFFESIKFSFYFLNNPYNQSFSLVTYYNVTITLVFIFSVFSLMYFNKKYITKTNIITIYFFNIFFIMSTFINHGFQPWSYLDIGLYPLSFVLLNKKKPNYILFYLVCFLSILNRETGLLILSFPLVKNLFNDKRISLKSIYFLLIMTIGCMLYYLFLKTLPYNENTNSILDVFKENISVRMIIQSIIIYYWMYFIIIKSNLNYIINSWISVPFIVLFGFILVFGIWIESRMFLPFLFYFNFLLNNKLNEKTLSL